MAPRSSVWDHAADKDLLLTIIDGEKLKGIEWNAVAEKMAEKEYTFTGSACRQHFQKIRKESRSDTGSPNRSISNSNSTTATPRKSNSTTKGLLKTPTSSKRPAINGSSNEYCYDLDDEEDTPSKKRKFKKPEPYDGEIIDDGLKDEFLAGGFEAPLWKEGREGKPIDLDHQEYSAMEYRTNWMPDFLLNDRQTLCQSQGISWRGVVDGLNAIADIRMPVRAHSLKQALDFMGNDV